MSNGKGSGRRKEAKPGAYASGWDALWGKKKENRKSKEAEKPKQTDNDPYTGHKEP